MICERNLKARQKVVQLSPIWLRRCAKFPVWLYLVATGYRSHGSLNTGQPRDAALDDLDLNPILVRVDGATDLVSCRNMPRAEYPIL